MNGICWLPSHKLRYRINNSLINDFGPKYHPFIRVLQQKSAIDQKVSTCTGSLQAPCINVATHHFSMAGARMAVFLKASPSCFHATLKLGDQGCPTVFARVQVGWLFFEKPSKLAKSDEAHLFRMAKALVWAG